MRHWQALDGQREGSQLLIAESVVAAQRGAEPAGLAHPVERVAVEPVVGIGLARPVEHHFGEREQGTRLVEGGTYLAARTMQSLSGFELDERAVAADLADQLDRAHELVGGQLGDGAVTGTGTA